MSGAEVRPDLLPAWEAMRPHVVQVLIYHQHTETSGCICGWAKLGASHVEHVASVIEETLALVSRFDGYPATGGAS